MMHLKRHLLQNHHRLSRSDGLIQFREGLKINEQLRLLLEVMSKRSGPTEKQNRAWTDWLCHETLKMDDRHFCHFQDETLDLIKRLRTEKEATAKPRNLCVASQAPNAFQQPVQPAASAAAVSAKAAPSLFIPLQNVIVLAPVVAEMSSCKISQTQPRQTQAQPKPVHLVSHITHCNLQHQAPLKKL